jgi:Ni2+-binding GTPase involved in maturation of urease and hydrogenase
MPETRARYVMIGGFLGAGKTTAMLRLGKFVAATGLRVGLVTNDQSSGLTDTALASASGLPVEEITGGCFCCRFNSLMEAAERLTARTTPDVFIAEPVGSCTDLKATVSYPLRRMYGDGFSVAPFSVMVDPVRALRVLGLEEGRMFSAKVLYVYEKQLEEADIIVINKIDTIDAARLSRLRAALHDRYPAATVFEVSARTGAGLEPWFSHVLGSEDHGRANLAIDYDDYAAGEALLGWLNCTARVSGPTFDGNEWVLGFMARIQDRLRERDIEIAHLKMTLAPAGNDTDLAVANVVGTDARPATPFSLQDTVTDGDLIVNLRAEADPEILARELKAAVAEHCVSSGVTLTVDHLEHFRPGRPVPTHRMVIA